MKTTKIIDYMDRVNTLKEDTSLTWVEKLTNLISILHEMGLTKIHVSKSEDFNSLDKEERAKDIFELIYRVYIDEGISVKGVDNNQ